MGMARRARAGRPADRARLVGGTPARVVVDASTPAQQVWRGTLGDLAGGRGDAHGRGGIAGADRDRRSGICGGRDALRSATSGTADSTNEGLCQPSMIRPLTAARGCRLPTRPTSTSSSACSSKYERGEITPDQWRAFRLVRGTYGQRQAEDAQMLRVKIPQGAADDAAAVCAGRGRRAVFARVRPHHDAAEHPVPFRQAARRRAGDAAAGRRRPDDARGVRQLGAQHHRLPVRRRVGRRTCSTSRRTPKR